MMDRHKKTLAWFAVIERMLAEYHPMTFRQVFYRFVSEGLMTNDESGYGKIQYALLAARQDGVIPWAWIEDRLRIPHHVSMWDDLAQRWRKYFPDFFVRLTDDSWMVIEVKAAAQVEHPNVKAKDARAKEVFEDLSGIFYKMIEDDKVRRGDYHQIFRWAR